MCNSFDSPAYTPTERAPLSLRLQEAPFDELPWIRAARDGDPSAQSWLVTHFTPGVYRFAYRLLGNEQDARDAAQDTMIKVLRNLDRYDAQWRFSTWVFGIARNTCIDEHRRRRPTDHDEVLVHLADPTPGPVELSIREERAQLLRQALGQLPPMYREVLVLYHFEHLKYEEIAAVLALPLGTVMNRIFRARKRLRELYDGLESPADSPEGGSP